MVFFEGRWVGFGGVVAEEGDGDLEKRRLKGDEEKLKMGFVVEVR